MKPPKGLFWAWIDIDGGGKKWRLAHITGSSSEPKIHYPLDGFEDYWYDDDFEEGDIVLIERPQPRTHEP
jgi:hypothetical protein